MSFQINSTVAQRGIEAEICCEPLKMPKPVILDIFRRSGSQVLADLVQRE
jgi:hypothetical protein